MTTAARNPAGRAFATSTIASAEALSRGRALRPQTGDCETERRFSRTNRVDGSIQIDEPTVGENDAVVVNVRGDVNDKTIPGRDARSAMQRVADPSCPCIATKIDEQAPSRAVDLGESLTCDAVNDAVCVGRSRNSHADPRACLMNRAHNDERPATIKYDHRFHVRVPCPSGLSSDRQRSCRRSRDAVARQGCRKRNLVES
jgi:hypothetical protein